MPKVVKSWLVAIVRDKGGTLAQVARIMNGGKTFGAAQRRLSMVSRKLGISREVASKALKTSL